jgi:long-chain acyl-CoA synthetase
LTVYLPAPQLSFNDLIARHGKWYAQRTAAVCGNDRLSWTELASRTSKVANALLAKGLQKGDRACLLLENSIAALELTLGIIRAGGIVVPLNKMMIGDSIAIMISNADPRFLFADASSVEQLDRIRAELKGIGPADFVIVGSERQAWTSYPDWIGDATDADPGVPLHLMDTCNIIYSSGTTGVPKGIEHSHFARLTYCLGFGLDLQFSNRSRTILTTPLYANGTWMTMMPTLFCGGTLVIMPKFDAKDFLATVQRERCTHTFMVPTQFIVTIPEVSAGDYDTRSLSVLICSGSPLSNRTFEEIGEAFPSGGLYEIYGMSEGFSTCMSPADRSLGKVGSVGLPILDGDIQIIGDHGRPMPVGEVGEIVGYSSSLMNGYYRDPERTEEAVWRDASGRPYLRSGDLGRIDRDGYLYIAGRKKDMILSGGMNIFASDVEEVFMRHPAVSEVAVIGIPHAKWGETPALLAIMKADANITAEDVKQWGNAQLAKFQRVSLVEFCDEFPRNALGKIMKRELREPYWASEEK